VRDDAITFPAPLLAAASRDSRVQQALEKDRSLFRTRREALASETALMLRQRERIEHEIGALEAQLKQVEVSLNLQKSELELKRRLLDIALRMKAIVNDYVKTASDALKMANARLGEIEQELRKSTDASARQVVAAPAAGEVIDLKFTSPGSVIRPGEQIADIVPLDARLLLEAHIRPADINNVRPERHPP